MGAGGGLPSTTSQGQKRTSNESGPEVAQGDNGATAVDDPDPSKKTTIRLDKPKDELVTGLGPYFGASSLRRPAGWGKDEMVVGLTTVSSLHLPCQTWSTSSTSWSMDKYVPSFVADPEAPKP